MSFWAVAVSTRMCAIPVGPSTATTADVSTPASVRPVRARSANASFPTAPIITVDAPARAAAMAWFAPLPPSTMENRSPTTVSPGRGAGEANAVRSTLMLPTTATPPLDMPAA